MKKAIGIEKKFISINFSIPMNKRSYSSTTKIEKQWNQSLFGGHKALPTFAKRFILDVWQDSE